MADRCDQINILLTALKACRRTSDLEKGKLLHADAIRSGDESSIYVGNSLLSMYGKCRSSVDAQTLFERMPHRDVVSWNALIMGYVNSGQGKIAMELFNSMQRENCKPDARSFVAVVKACASTAATEETWEIDGKPFKVECLKQAKKFHSQATNAGFDSNIYLANTLIDSYAKCGSLIDARRIFDRISCRSVVSWNAMLLGCAENGEAEEGLKLFECMESECCEPDARTFVAALKNCSVQAAKEKAQMVDGKLVKIQSLEIGTALHSAAARKKHDADGYVTSSLVDMYSKCGSLGAARNVFEKSPHRCVVSWNALLLGHVENGECETALELFSAMQRECCAPDALTFVAVLKACSVLARIDPRVSLERGMAIHSLAAKFGYDSDTSVMNNLVDMYTKCGSLTDASRVFNTASRSPVLWNTMLLGYVESGEAELALQLFLRLADDREKKIAPDGRTFAAALKACSSVGSINIAAAIHAKIHQFGLETDPVLVTCLVDTYCRCGSMVRAQLVFDTLVLRDLITWNAILTGYSRHGQHERVVELFEKMQDEELEADSITFVAVLSACSHCGLVDRGRDLFQAMVERHGVGAEIEHYHCLVDMLGRADRCGDALDTVKAMPFGATGVTWTTVLGSCRDATIGRLAFESLLAIGDAEPAAYSLMGNIYGAEDKDHRIRKLTSGIASRMET